MPQKLLDMPAERGHYPGSSQCGKPVDNSISLRKLCGSRPPACGNWMPVC